MPSKLPRLVTRVPEDVHKKIEYLAEHESRTISKELEHIIKLYITKYEAENGSIKIK